MDNLAKPSVAPSVPVDTTPGAPREIGDAGRKVDAELYMTYQLDHDVPFVADYYGIGNMLDYADLPYKAEVDSIDNYLIAEVKSKRLANTTDAIKSRLTQLEKIAGIDKNAPASIRVKLLAAHSEYIAKMNSINNSPLML